MKKIAIDLTSLNDNFSGLERYSFEVVKNLILLDNKNKYVLIFKNEVFPFFINLNHTNVEFYVVYGSKLKVNQFKRNKAIKKINPDIIYFPAFPPSLFLRKKKKMHIISMIHDLVAWDCPKTMKFKSRLLFKTGIKHAIKISDILTVNSCFTKTRLMEKFSIKKEPIIVPCATNKIDDYIFFDFSSVQKEYDLPTSYYLSLGTLEPRKNFAGLLKFYSEFKKEKPDCPKLVIVGRKGWKMDKLLDEYQNISDSIIFTGFVKDEYLPSIYKNATAFLFASIYEGFGIPIVETIRFGTLPIVSNIPSTNELLGNDYPYKFELTDYTSFSNALMSFGRLTEEEKEKLVLKMQTLTDKYQWINSGKIMYDLINNIE